MNNIHFHKKKKKVISILALMKLFLISTERTRTYKRKQMVQHASHRDD